jgi:membrane-associated tyrosine/threonine-specific cdc2-inhibitory kinase
VLNDKPTKAADIFSLGMTILELATDLDLPNNGVFWHEIRNRIIDDKYINCESEPASSLQLHLFLLAALTPELRHVTAWMIDPNPLNRPKAREVLNDPAIKRFKARRQFYLRKHRVVRLPPFRVP